MCVPGLFLCYNVLHWEKKDIDDLPVCAVHDQYVYVRAKDKVDGVIG